MSHEDNLKYWERRAEQELRIARSARNPDAARVHYHLAGHYFDRVHRDFGADRVNGSPSEEREE